MSWKGIGRRRSGPQEAFQVAHFSWKLRPGTLPGSILKPPISPKSLLWKWRFAPAQAVPGPSEVGDLFRSDRTAAAPQALSRPLGLGGAYTHRPRCGGRGLIDETAKLADLSSGKRTYRWGLLRCPAASPSAGCPNSPPAPTLKTRHTDPTTPTMPAPIVIDGKGHLLGRLASIVAKQAISGQKVVVVRCEEINVSGSFFRLKLRWADHMHKRHLVNPKKSGPFHHRAPSRILYKAIRGMIPHKTARGAAALQRLKLFEGMPPPYDRKKKMVVPQALRVLRLKPGRKWCTIKRLSHEYGWGYKDVVDTLEAKRKVKAQAFHERKVALLKARKQVAAQDATQTVQSQLAALGY
ncbi:hypothetical protein PTTG_06040 [Puccinia triticina 1-1 BBBD Race 1]|uniref:Ribosomal protein L13 n=3 Tax=Puccinia triticina TaxID=208348 RepID=A0A180GVR7_PUCT1|nr:hypothetical protein PTTG_06040 [Puccinia triticina 1-1 BBBD Race 1]